MINQYIVKILFEGHVYERDVNCPPEWRGSGCYDHDIKVQTTTNIKVWAENASDAERLAKEYRFLAETDAAVENITARIISVTLVKALPDRGEDEVGVIEPVNIEW